VFLAGFIALCLLLLLSGCIKGQEIDSRQENTVIQKPPVVNVNVPKAEVVDLDAVKREISTEIQTSSNNTSNQLSGLVNASVSKLAEKVTGLEASISANMTNTAVANLKSEVQASAAIVTSLRADIRNSIDVNTKLDATLTAINQMSLSVGKIETQMTAAAAAQVGLENSFEQKLETINTTVKTGRDSNINYLPQAAVDIMLAQIEAANENGRSQNRLWMYIMGGIFTAVTTIAGYAYRNARLREQGTAKLLMQALAQLPPEKAEVISANPGL
jgi:hypothetical protein